jgi:hypothetical protein
VEGIAMTMKPLFVRVEWDDEACVWVATSDDVPGLATEQDAMEGLIKKKINALLIFMAG